MTWLPTLLVLDTRDSTSTKDRILQATLELLEAGEPKVSEQAGVGRAKRTQNSANHPGEPKVSEQAGVGRAKRTQNSANHPGEPKGVRMADIAKGAGISRQALYLHYRTRAELLIASTHFLDEVKGSHKRLEASRNADKGVDRLDAYVRAWAGYIPEIYGMAKSILAMQETDEEAASAWRQRMHDMREGCEAAMKALKHDKMLSSNYSMLHATDLLWTMLSVRNWEHMTQECGWSQRKYTNTMLSMARQLFVAS